MVCAAVSARVSPESIEKIYSVRLVPKLTKTVDINTVADLINAAALCLPGTIVAEPGDLYNLETWRASSILGREFKYPETLAERTAVELAHHVSLAGRRLITNGGEEYLDGN
jgi:hypothetical protein